MNLKLKTLPGIDFLRVNLPLKRGKGLTNFDVFDFDGECSNFHTIILLKFKRNFKNYFGGS